MEMFVEKMLHSTVIRIVGALICIIVPLNVTAKDVKGIIKNKQDNNPIANVAIQIIWQDAEATALSDSVGKFLIALPDSVDECDATFTHVAYNSYNAKIGSDSLLRIFLTPKDNMLEEIVVKADFIQREGLKSVVNVSRIPNADNMEMDRILKQVPGVMETGEGAYTLNGKNAVIFVNGIEQKITGKSLDAFLSSLPAKAVKSVELVPINAGKYKSTIDAVIDIKLNNNVPLGHTLHVNTSADYRDSEISEAGVNLFYMTKVNRWLFHNTLTYSNESNRAAQIDSLFYDKRLITGNKSRNEGRDNTLVYQASLSYNRKNEDNIIFNTFIYNDFGKTESNWLDGNLLTNQFRKTRNDLYNLDVSYQIPSSKKKFNGAVSYSFSYGGRHADMEYPLHEDNMETEGRTDMEGWMNMLNMDFSSEIGNWTFEYGSQVDYNSVWDRSIYKMAGGQENMSRMTGREILAAAYADVTYKFNDKLSLLAGGRVEHTDYKYKTQGETNHVAYTDFFPSLIFIVNTPFYDCRLGGTSRISRPKYQDMLPGIHKLNDYMYQKGNPDMKPANVYYLMCYNTLFDFLELNFTYSYAKDATSYIFDIENDKCLVWYDNAGNLRTLYANVVLPFTFFNDKLTGQIQWDGSYRDIQIYKDGFEVPEGRKNHFFINSYSLTLNFNPSERLNIMSSFSYTPEKNTSYSWNEKKVHMDFELAYSALKNKNLTIGISIKDLFGKDIYSNIYFMGGEKRMMKEWMGMTAGITLRYKFNKGQNVVDEYRDYSPKTSRFE